MSESISLVIPVLDGTKQTVNAIKVTAHFAVHTAIDVVVIKNYERNPTIRTATWTVTHIPTLCRVVFSDSQEHAEEVAQALEALPIDWNIQHPIKGNGKAKSLFVQTCRGLAIAGLAWAEWI